MIPVNIMTPPRSEALTSSISISNVRTTIVRALSSFIAPSLSALLLSAFFIAMIGITGNLYAQDDDAPLSTEPVPVEGELIESPLEPELSTPPPVKTPAPLENGIDNLPDSSKTAAIKLYNEGVTSYNDGDYLTAISKFEELLNLDTTANKNRIKTLLARTYTRYAYSLEEDTGDLTQAERYYQQAIETFKQTPVPYDQATKELYSFAHNRLGVMIYSTRYNITDNSTLPALREAFRNFNSAININKANSSAHNNKGIAYSVQGDSRPAIKSFTKAIEFNENNAVAYLNRGTDNFFINDYTAALSDFKEVLRYQVISDMITNQTEAAEALSYAEKMLGFTYLALANSHYHDGLYESAIENYILAMQSADTVEGGNSELASLKSNIHLYLGTTYAKKGDLNNAKTQLNAAIALNPNFASAYNNYGIIFYDEGNYEQAITYYTMAIEKNPRLGEAYLNRGNAYNQLGRIDEARSDYEQASQLGINIFAPVRSTAYNKKRRSKLRNTYVANTPRSQTYSTHRRFFSL
ncbi:hypothetical protein COTS27_00346 [Spirochaetota bacterium]|nr:hypothetical protein COTS27_00346 [Spirochaetota bacterium]